MTVRAWDAAEFLDDEEAIAEYLNLAFETGDSRVICSAMGDVAQARNMTKLAESLGVSRAGLYKALSPEGNPSLSFLNRFADALGLTIALRPKERTNEVS